MEIAVLYAWSGGENFLLPPFSSSFVSSFGHWGMAASNDGTLFHKDACWRYRFGDSKLWLLRAPTSSLRPCFDIVCYLSSLSFVDDMP